MISNLIDNHHIRSFSIVYDLFYQSNDTKPILPIQSHHRTKFKLVHSINHNLSFCKSTQHLIYQPSITFYHVDLSSNHERSHHHVLFFEFPIICWCIWFMHWYDFHRALRKFHFEFCFPFYNCLKFVMMLVMMFLDSRFKIIFRFAINFQTLESINMLHIMPLPRFNVIENSELPMVTFFISLSIIDLISSFWSWI